MKGSPLKGALLALVLEQDEPTYPYRLAMLLERRLGPAAGVDRDGVYKMLPGLEKCGLIASSTSENDSGDWRRHTVYAPTDLTESALDTWMATPVTDRARRTELQIKIAFSRPLDAPVLLRTLDDYERYCTKMFAECEEMDIPMSSWLGVKINVAVNWTEEHMNAELRWIMTSRESIGAYAKSAAVLRL